VDDEVVVETFRIRMVVLATHIVFIVLHKNISSTSALSPSDPIHGPAPNAE